MSVRPDRVIGAGSTRGFEAQRLWTARISVYSRTCSHSDLCVEIYVDQSHCYVRNSTVVTPFTAKRRAGARRVRMRWNYRCPVSNLFASRCMGCDVLLAKNARLLVLYTERSPLLGL